MNDKGKLGLMAAVFLIVAFFVIVEWRKSQNQPAPTVAQAAITPAIKADLMKIARAQQYFLSQNDRYGTVQELIDAGALTMKSPGRGVYEYTVENTERGFIVIARAKGQEADRWPVITITERMDLVEEPARPR